jgi:hypothetical protein
MVRDTRVYKLAYIAGVLFLMFGAAILVPGVFGWIQVTAPQGGTSGVSGFHTDMLFEGETLVIDEAYIEQYYGDVCDWTAHTFKLNTVTADSGSTKGKVTGTWDGASVTLTRGSTSTRSGSNGTKSYLEYTTYVEGQGKEGATILFGFDGPASNPKYACVEQGRPLGASCYDNRICDPGLYCDMSKGGICSNAPAASPTVAPTVEPTVAPTVAHTVAPTGTPVLDFFCDDGTPRSECSVENPGYYCLVTADTLETATLVEAVGCSGSEEAGNEEAGFVWKNEYWLGVGVLVLALAAFFFRDRIVGGSRNG